MTAGSTCKLAPQGRFPHAAGHYDLATDSEWDKARPDPWLSTAFAGDAGTVVYMTPDIPDGVRGRLRRAAEGMGVHLLFQERKDGTNLIADYLDRLDVTGSAVRLLMYFSPKDLEYAAGWHDFRAAIEGKRVRQRNNLSGRLDVPGRKVFVRDLCGWAGKQSLLRFATSLGIAVPEKAVMDDYKARMYDGLVERPEEFLRYAVGDVTLLRELHDAFVEHFRAIQRECLDMEEDDLWSAEEMPTTGGALVARTLERWLLGRADAGLLAFCTRKLGVLDPDDRRIKFSRWAFNSVVGRFRSAGRLRAALENEPDRDLAQFYKARFLHTGLDACSVRWWAGRPLTDTAGFNALVQGGRCQNEQPFLYSLDRSADIDISGCYGEALRSLSYPIGLPSVWSSTPNQPGMTLGQWLDRHEGDLVPGLWTATVSGGLGFEQDLIHSKLVRQSDLRRSAQGGDGDSDIPGDFVMLRRQVRNGIITGDVLAALRSICTNAEWAGIRSLDVVTACAYLKSNRRDDLDSWIEAVIGDRGSYRMVNGEARDTRTRAWAAVPLEGFIGRLYERRKFYKARKLDAEAEEERQKAAGMDAMLKLTVNMVYGVLSARYFAVGNTVVANNITARARLGVWMMAKALGLRQTITDGGCYRPEAVCHFEGKHPGLDTLSRPWDWHAPNRRRWHRPMGGRDWSGAWPGLHELDGLAAEHIRGFWGPYSLEFPFRVEHKAVIERGACWSKGDYAFRLGDGRVTYAVRGKDKGQKGGQHPSFRLLDAILEGRDDFPAELDYWHTGIMKLGKYLVVQSSRGYEHLKHLRPGDDYAEERTARYNNAYFPLRDEEDFLRRRGRRKTNRGRPVRWFEKYGQKGIAAVHRRMAEDNLKN